MAIRLTATTDHAFLILDEMHISMLLMSVLKIFILDDNQFLYSRNLFFYQAPSFNIKFTLDLTDIVQSIFQLA